MLGRGAFVVLDLARRLREWRGIGDLEYAEGGEQAHNSVEQHAHVVGNVGGNHEAELPSDQDRNPDECDQRLTILSHDPPT
jgi:hypothetical protein